MENKKRLKRTKLNGSEDLKEHNNGDAEANYTMCSSSDFPSSQECFSVGWDWSGQRSDKPSVRVIERPVQRRNESVELLQCQRKRQFVRKSDPDMFDASVFVDQLKSLAAGFKSVPESTSPVASPPPSIRRRDLIVTPTALRKASATLSSVGSSNSSASPALTRSGSFKDVKDNLNDLLDDSLGADLILCTQELEHTEKKSLTTPTLQEVGLSSSKRKHRLSLSSSKNSKTVCRRINDIYEKQASGNQKTSNVHKEENQDKQNNNKNVLSKDEFDDFDEATLLTLGDLEEKSKVQPTAEESIQRGEIINVKDTQDSSSGMEDDEFVSPDLLCMIDAWEKKATQEKLVQPVTTKPLSTLNIHTLNVIDEEKTVKPKAEVKKHQLSMNETQKGQSLSKPLLASNTGPSKPLTAASTGPSKPLSAASTGPSKPLSAPSIGSSKPLLTPSSGPSKPFSALRTGPWKPLSAPSTGSSKPPSASNVVPPKLLSDRSLASSSRNLLDAIDEQHEKGTKSKAEPNRHQPTKKSLSLGGGALKCTPEEIEKKRLEARKRLQLKKKQL